MSCRPYDICLVPLRVSLNFPAPNRSPQEIMTSAPKVPTIDVHDNTRQASHLCVQTTTKFFSVTGDPSTADHGHRSGSDWRTDGK